MRIPLALASICALLAVCASACDDAPSSPAAANPDVTVTPRPLPSPVTVRDDPQGVGLEDPAFEALPGAQAEFGRLGGSVYRIEVPADWNGRLVLYLHGFQGLAPEASVQNPGIRRWLIDNGYAWGASSYSSTALIPGRAADETAALWDHFVARHGRPARTYVTGHSMGGAATAIAAERYADRFDGALGLCGFAGQPAITRIIGDWFYAAAFAAGVTQEEFDTTPLDVLINERLRPALADPARHDLWTDILIDMTGGPRVFDRQGFTLEEATNWMRSPILVGFGLAHNQEREYALSPAAGVSSAEFNARVVRRAPATEEQLANFDAGNTISGDLQMPLLTLHTTGDWQVPVDQQRLLRQTVEAAGKGDLLVQRIVRDPQHCGFTESEWIEGLRDLQAWVEDGVAPAGEDVMVADLRSAGTRFTRAPRFGSPEADAAPGAGGRLTIRGTISLDGEPVDGAYLWFEVESEPGLRQYCSFLGAPPFAGRYERTVMADAEAAGCGAPGRSLVAVAFYRGTAHRSLVAAAWPGGGARTLTFDVELDSAESSVTEPVSFFYGGVTTAAGEAMPPGTVVEAYAGYTLCGRAALPHVLAEFQGPESYALRISRARQGCEAGPYAFHVDGEPTGQTAPHGDAGQRVDLVAR